jgi:hypothetical protein
MSNDRSMNEIQMERLRADRRRSAAQDGVRPVFAIAVCNDATTHGPHRIEGTWRGWCAGTAAPAAAQLGPTVVDARSGTTA